MSIALDDVVVSVFNEVYLTQVGKEPPELRSDAVLLETGLDSLGFAILVTRLEEELGYDPFTLSEEAYYPQTIGDFVDFYRKYDPR